MAPAAISCNSRWINTSTSTEDNTMPQLVEPTTPDAQRGDHQTGSGRDRHRSRNRSARRTSGFSGFSDSAELGGITCHDGMSSRSVRRRLVTCFSDRLSHHRTAIGRRSTERTGITLRRREWSNRCYRCDGRLGERGMTVSKRLSSDRGRRWVETNWRGLSSGSGGWEKSPWSPDQPGTSTGLGYDLA